VILVDGSPSDVLKSVVEKFKNALPIQHEHRPSLAISPSRNLGAEIANGEYLIFLDSDIILPDDYLVQVDSFIQKNNPDSFGGPDKAHESFNATQKAISYAMTSFLTTGGIRGGKKHMHQFHPRGFNMGIKKTVFDSVQGYSNMTCGEDIELSIRIIEAGYKVQLNPEAFVYHKRRSTFKSFFRQVYRFGAARINIFQRHRKELKLTHLFPSLFVLFIGAGITSSFFSTLFFQAFLYIVGSYFLIILIDSTLKNKSFKVGILSMITSLFQLTGYGLGFISNLIAVFIGGKKDGIELGASK
jgi:cellulose synthase/poly-beta-1,6-N-acetylglucosamine synthase-like glycosyltransferase